MMNQLDTLLYSIFLKGTDLNIWFLFGNVSFISIPEKWKSFGGVLNNIFMGNEKREEITTAFYNIQRVIHGMYRFKHIWRTHRAKWYNADDLYMNPISPKDRGAIVLFENNTKYIFQLRELIKMVHSSLSNCCHFFPEPIQCKNPYTNLPFHKSNLYNIYFAVRSSQYSMSPLFEAFFRLNFNLKLFLTKYEELINEEYLKTYVDNNCVKDVLDHVVEMFKIHEISVKIHSDFPKDNLFNIMKPYLLLYYESNYSLNIHKKARAFRLLHRKLHKFHEFNNCFGRRKVKFIIEKPFFKKKCVYVFEDKHPPFNEVEINNFMKSHLDTPVVRWSHHMDDDSSRDDDSGNDDDDNSVYDDDDNSGNDDSVYDDDDNSGNDDDDNSGDEEENNPAIIFINHTYNDLDDDLNSVD